MQNCPGNYLDLLIVLPGIIITRFVLSIRFHKLQLFFFYHTLFHPTWIWWISLCTMSEQKPRKLFQLLHGSAQLTLFNSFISIADTCALITIKWQFISGKLFISPKCICIYLCSKTMKLFSTIVTLLSELKILQQIFHCR